MTEIYQNSPENYKDRARRGIVAVSVREDPDNYPNRWITLSDNFGEVCYREPNELNGRNIDLGGSNEAILFGKMAYCRRTWLNSGCDARDVKAGESFWMGAIFESDFLTDTNNVIFGFSGFTELDDVKVAKAGREAYFKSFE